MNDYFYKWALSAAGDAGWQLLKVLAPLLLAMITKKVNELIESKTHTQQLLNLGVRSDVAVKAVEQTMPNALPAEKKAAAVHLVVPQTPKAVQPFVASAIEAKVKELPKTEIVAVSVVPPVL